MPKSRAHSGTLTRGGAVVERFAPSPTGRLHLGHAFSALTAHAAAEAAGGVFLLRFEDLDAGRARPEYYAAIEEDLGWLGLSWPEPPLRQSSRSGAYRDALASLEARGLLYPCFCTRRDIAEALSAPQEAGGGAASGSTSGAPAGVDGPVYPGTCRALSPKERAERLQSGAPFALRLDMRKAIAALGGDGVVSKLSFKELGRGPAGERGKVTLDPAWLREACGDVVLARKDAPASYHLAVVVDDAHQGVTHVTRGEDLFGAAKLHRLLQALLGRSTPVYRHHGLIRDAEGRRLAKRAGAESLEALRAAGAAPGAVRKRLGLA